jgi:hypothetical protein
MRLLRRSGSEMLTYSATFTRWLRKWDGQREVCQLQILMFLLLPGLRQLKYNGNVVSHRVDAGRSAPCAELLEKG